MTGRRRRLTALLGALGVVVVLGSVAAAPVDLTSGAWTDAEWVNDALLTRDCAQTGNYTTIASGRFVDAQAAGLDLDTVASASGLSVVNDGTSATPTPATAIGLGDDAFKSAVDITTLNSEAPTLAPTLDLPAPGQAAGVYNQFGQAHSTGSSTGAAGAVTDEGAVRVNEAEPEPGLPGTGTAHLGSLAPDAAPLADAHTEIGAVAASSTLDACAEPPAVTRDYGIEYLRLVQDGETLPDFVAGVDDAVVDVESTVQTLQTSLLDNITSLLNSLGLVQVEIELTVELSDSVSSLLDQQLSDPDGVVVLDLAAGTMTVDLNALLISQGGAGLNGRNPNTELLDGDFFATAVPYAVGLANSLLADLQGDVTAAVTANLAATDIHIEAYIPPILLTPRIDLLEIDGPLYDDPDVMGDELTITVLGALPVSAATILASVQNELNAVVSGALADLEVALADAASTLGGAFDAVLEALDVLSIMVNVQPDQPGAPAELTATPGVYEVSALRMGVLGGSPVDTFVNLARATAGPNDHV